MVAVMIAMLLPVAALLSRAEVDDLDLKEHPVAKVVNMLKKMQETMQEEAKKDQEVYEKMSCWCEVNDKETNAAVEAAQRAISELTAKIEEKAALAARLETEIEQLAAEIKAAEEAIATATALREKEHEAFSAEEKEMVATISALTDAIGVLSKHHPGALISVQSSLKKLKALGHLEGMKQHAEALLQQPAGYASYNTRSGEIFGILKTMKETFETNLAQTRKEEAEAQRRFDELIAEKRVAINKATERKNTKVMEMSEAKSALVQAKADLKDVRSNLDADTKFIVDLREKCSASDTEFQERVKSRQEEMVAVGEALTMLTDDSARDLFSSTLGFVQTRLAGKRKQLVDVLKRAAKKHPQSAKLSLLAQSAQLDAFTKVKAAIDEMIVELQTQQKDEATHRTWCTDELRKNELQHQDKTWEAEDLGKRVNVLADKIATLDGEIAALTENVAENKRQIKRASEDREAANAVFQQTVADQRATVAILNKVLARLQKVYEPEAVKESLKPKAFLQRQPQVKLGSRTADAAPEGFGAGGKQQAGGVLGLIRMCIADAERLQKESVDAEQTAQTDYEKMVKDSANEIAADDKSINDKSSEKAQAEVEKEENSAGLEAATAAIADLEKYATGVHASCDFVLQNFDIRQQARAEEIDALEDAKAILSGADFQ